MPSYNQAEFLEEAILSVLNQDYPNIEYIIMDGGSTDGSVDIIRKYEDRLDYWVSEPDRGQSQAVNKGWRMAKGEILGWLNSDDMYCPGAVSRVVGAYLANPEAVVFYGDCQAISHVGEHLYTRTMQNYTISQMLCGKFPTQPAVFVHRSVLDDLGYLDESLHYSMDGDFFLRVWYRYSENQFCYIPHSLAGLRLYIGTKTSQGNEVAAALETVFDRFFAQDDLDNEILALRRCAYSNVSWRRARFALKNNRRTAAIGHLLKALLFAPSSYHPLRIMRFFAIALLPGPVFEHTRRLLRRMRAYQQKS